MVGLDNSFLRIDAMRHGETEYRQGIVSIDEANDLTPEGGEEVTRSANKLADVILQELDEFPDLSVEIGSSPYARALYSAEITRDIFRGKRIPLREDGKYFAGGVQVIDELGMFRRSVDWKLLSPLIKGGKVNFNGETFDVDNRRTNPNSFGVFDYLFKDGIGSIPNDVRAELPADYLQVIDGIEKTFDCTQRFMSCISGYAEVRGPRHVVLTTHSELLYYPANVFSRGEVNLVDSGAFVSFERRDGKLVVTGVGDLTEGRDDVDIISAFTEDYPLMRDGQEPVYFK